MIFDGIKWRRSRTVVVLPADPTQDKPNHLRFGRICEQMTKGSVKTDYKWKNGNPVHAKPITPNGWSLTNMMYGKSEVRDGIVYVRAYLCRGGQCYTARWIHEEETIRHQVKDLVK